MERVRLSELASVPISILFASRTLSRPLRKKNNRLAVHMSMLMLIDYVRLVSPVSLNARESLNCVGVVLDEIN